MRECRPTRMNKTEQIFQLSAPFDNEYQGKYRRVLFVCSAGLLRSATAAYVGSLMGFNTRNCGSENYALIPISVNLINWAQSIYFVNEYNYLSTKETFAHDVDILEQLEEKSNVWDIPDVYNYRSPKLIQIIEELLS